MDRKKEYSFVLSTMRRLHARSRLLEFGVFVSETSNYTKALFTRYKLAWVRPGLKLTRVSFCRVNTAKPGSARVKSNPPQEVGSTRVEPGLAWKSVV